MRRRRPPAPLRHAPLGHRYVMLAVALTAGLAVLGAAVLGAMTAAPAAAASPSYSSLGYPWATAPSLYNQPAQYDAGYPLAQCQDEHGVMDPAYPDLSIACTNGAVYEPAKSAPAAAVNGYALLDPWNYFLRNCTSFVAWQLYEHGVAVKYFFDLGNGGDWYTNAQRRAPADRPTFGTTPSVGAAAVAPGLGHVAYVLAVNPNGTITVAEYNANQGTEYGGDGDERTGTPGALGFSEYVYFAPLMTNGWPSQLVTGRVPVTVPGAWAAVPPRARAQGNDILDGVSCVSASFCVAVGQSWYRPTHEYRALTESYNNGTWAVVPAPRGFESELNGVSCTGTDKCIAVGNTRRSDTAPDRPLIESFNGSTWSDVAAPSVKRVSGYLLGVSCAAPRFCVAVGYARSAADAEYTLIETYNGSSWSLTPSPSPFGSRPVAALRGVSCPSSTFCMAVGNWQDKAGQQQVLVEKMSGPGAHPLWTVSPEPVPPSRYEGVTSGNMQLGVSCPTEEFCMSTLAYVGSRTIVEQFNGDKWAIKPAPDQTVGHSQQPQTLSGVDCANPGLCALVGYYFVPGSGADRAVADSHIGSGWAPSAVEYKQGTSVLQAVSCAPSGFCLGVGWANAGGVLVPIAVRTLL